MAYDPTNNPYLPGDPYSYDLKWMVQQIKGWKDPLDSADRAEASEEAAKLSEQQSEAWAVGTIDGDPAPADAPQHDNNSKFWAGEAANSAGDARNSADAAGNYAAHIADPVTGLVTEWLDVHITNPSNPPVDTSLMVGGAAADAKVTGESVERSLLTTERLYDVDGDNLFDPLMMITIGALQADDSISAAGAWANYKTSDFIPLESNEDYTLATFDAMGSPTSNRKVYALYDSAKTMIPGSYANLINLTSITFNSSTASYVRISSENGYPVQLEKSSSPGPYSDYDEQILLNKKLGNEPITQILDLMGDVLHGKKWAVCGDSFTAGATATVLTDGMYQGYPCVYPYIIGNRTKMQIIKFFQSGRTLAYPADHTVTNCLTYSGNSEYYQNIPADVDYITIYLGINDSHKENAATGQIPLGDISDVTADTYYGAWNEVLTWLITNRPFAHIGIIVSNGCDREAYRQAQIDIATKYGIAYIDLNGDSNTPMMIRSMNPDIDPAVKTIVDQKQAVNYPSNTHPNDDAHIYESTFIEDFLRRI